MAGDQLVTAVRRQLGLGRLLPLGGPADGAWIAERAAAGVLRQAGDALPGLRVGTLRLSLADADAAPEAAVPSPPSALPPGPLLIEADVAATAGRPVPASAGLLREALLACAAERLGLDVSVVDVRVTDLLDEDEAEGAKGEGGEGETGGGQVGDAFPGGGATAGDAGPLEAAVLRVPGAVRLVPALGALSRPVREEDGHVLVQLAVAPDRRTLDVARDVRAAVGKAADAGQPADGGPSAGDGQPAGGGQSADGGQPAGGRKRPTVAVLVAALEPPAAA
ncbi:hypothetical protein [Streptomyces paromomycinus]|uniref:Nucleopolyhedrovirus P10 family protein n=1 Tax=Streptomyces paromomycinus TaxID=92743 RepID=A0A401WBM6_STREY|nr:hypothetical protein [Streptomyces paromomycinus]GCD46756.1 hypothetical protein GKJPGBOP_06507 [Streptomyces paromomycinus]